MTAILLATQLCALAAFNLHDATHVHVNGRAPHRLTLQFHAQSSRETVSSTTPSRTIDLLEDTRSVSPDVEITVHGSGGTHGPVERPRGVFRGDGEADGHAHATWSCAGSSGCLLAFALTGADGETMYAVNASLDGLHGTAPLSQITSSTSEARRRLQLELPAPPYSRLTHCLAKPTVHEVSMGLLLDHGFVAVAGGREAALREAAVAVSRANAIFEGQIGIRLVVKHIILNEDGTGDYPSSGPNSAPLIPGTRSCPAYEPMRIDGHGLPVISDEIDVALDYFSAWVGRHAPGGPPGEGPNAPALWHLMSNCFPSPGTVGIAQLYSTCQPAARLEFIDSGIPAAATASARDDGCATVVVATGNCATATLRGACGEEDVVCRANTGISSWSYDGTFWHTFAHEVAHNLGAEHTFKRGGLMSYQKEKVRLCRCAVRACPFPPRYSGAAAPCVPPPPPLHIATSRGALTTGVAAPTPPVPQ